MDYTSHFPFQPMPGVVIYVNFIVPFCTQSIIRLPIQLYRHRFGTRTLTAHFPSSCAFALHRMSCSNTVSYDPNLSHDTLLPVETYDKSKVMIFIKLNLSFRWSVPPYVRLKFFDFRFLKSLASCLDYISTGCNCQHFSEIICIIFIYYRILLCIFSLYYSKTLNCIYI